jgi:hypothetical protein
MQQVQIFMDSTFTQTFTKKTGNNVSVEQLTDALSTVDDEVVGTLFYQRDTGISSKGHDALKWGIENVGWNFDPCLDDEILNSEPYAAIIELNRLTAVAVSEAWDSKIGKTKFIFCIGHLSYLPMLRMVQDEFEDIETVLVCDTDSTNPKVMDAVDTVVDLDTIGAEYEGATHKRGA